MNNNNEAQVLEKKEQWTDEPQLEEGISQIFGNYNFNCLVQENFVIQALFLGKDCPHFKDKEAIMLLYHKYHTAFHADDILSKAQSNKEVILPVHVFAILLFYWTYSLQGCTSHYDTVNKALVLQETLKMLKELDIVMI